MSTFTLTVLASENNIYIDGCPKLFKGSDIKIIGTKIIVPNYPKYLIWNPIDSSETVPDDAIETVCIEVNNVIYYVLERIWHILDHVNTCCNPIINNSVTVTLSDLHLASCDENIEPPGYEFVFNINFSNNSLFTSSTILEFDHTPAGLGVQDFGWGLVDITTPAYDISNNSLIVKDPNAMPTSIDIRYKINGDPSGFTCDMYGDYIFVTNISGIAPGVIVLQIIPEEMIYNPIHP